PLREGAPLLQEDIVWRLTEAGRQQALARLPKRAARLRGIVELLSLHGELAAAEIQAATKSASGLLRSLQARGFVEQLRRTAAARLPGSVAVHSGPPLNPAQQAAVDRIRRTLGSFASHLLHGVTGSGKTEVYLHAIAAALARG